MTPSTAKGKTQAASAKEPVAKETASEVASAPTPTPVPAAAAAASTVATTPQQFPSTKQFDTSLEMEPPQENGHNWSSSFYGLSTERFPKEVADILLEPINPDDVEVKPGEILLLLLYRVCFDTIYSHTFLLDGLIYLPEIKYRRILNRAFGPGGWGLAPRGEHTISPKNISREYALICSGRFVSQARGEQDFFDVSGLPTASEGCKSNALMRCCKDLGIASELW